jgi:hypothetical protein
MCIVFVVNTELSAEGPCSCLYLRSVWYDCTHGGCMTAAFRSAGKIACAMIRRWSGVEQIPMFSVFQSYVLFRIIEITNWKFRINYVIKNTENFYLHMGSYVYQNLLSDPRKLKIFTSYFNTEHTVHNSVQYWLHKKPVPSLQCLFKFT